MGDSLEGGTIQGRMDWEVCWDLGELLGQLLKAVVEPPARQWSRSSEHLSFSSNEWLFS